MGQAPEKREDDGDGTAAPRRAAAAPADQPAFLNFAASSEPPVALPLE